jgi:putative endonuclease
MAFVYVLISEKDAKRYIGSTNSLERRMAEHFRGEVKSTFHRRPLRLYAYERFESLSDARKWEQLYKSSRGRYDKAIESGKLVLAGV